MARNLSQLMRDIEFLYEQAMDVPALNDEDGATRLMLINQGIRRWAHYATTSWNELSDIAKTSPITIGQSVYDFPNKDFHLVDAVHDEDGNLIPVKTPAAATSIGQYVVISGNPNDGYKVNLGWQPTNDNKLTGQALTIVTSRNPMEFTDGDIADDSTKVAEMSNDDFLVKYVVAELCAPDDPALFNKYSQDAMTDLDNMRDQNQSIPAGSVESWADEQEGLGF